MTTQKATQINTLIVALVLALMSSFSSSAQASSLDRQAVTSYAPSLTSIKSAQSLSTIQRIRNRGKLIAGVKYDFKPFGFLDKDGQVVGFDVDLIQALADEWGIDVEFVQVTSSNRIPKLLAGEVDIVAASMTHKKDRDEQIDFSQTYFLDGQSLLVQRDSGINGIEDLDNKTVAAIQGSTSIDQIETYAAEKGVTIDIVPFLQHPPAVEALKAGQIDALTTDSVALSEFAKESPELLVVGGLFTFEPYGIGLPAGDSYFKNLVDFTLQSLKSTGVYDELYKKWFGPQSIPYEIEILPGEWPYTLDTSPVTSEQPSQSKIDQILARGKLIAGVKHDFEPFGYLDENNRVVGFDIDIVREFARRWLGDENAVELVQVTSSNRIQKLAAGEVDLVAASMTHKKERDEAIDFSQTYFLDGQSLLVRRNSGINSLTDLDGKIVTAIQGSTSIDNIQQVAADQGLNLEILPFQQYPQALAALTTNQVAALTTDSVALAQFAKDNPELVVVGGRFTREPYGLGVPSDDHWFRDLVNFTLQAMKEDGSYDVIYCRWFGSSRPYDIEIWPGQPQDPQLQGLVVTNSPLLPDENCSAGTQSSAASGGESLSVPILEPGQLPVQYTIVKGDTLSLLAGRFYGDIFLWQAIYQANRDIIGDNPDVIDFDTIITIPKLP
jgi:polar amino acid transport system substrate-binding protein